MGSSTKRVYEFGAFRLNTAERLLLLHGESVPLTPKVFDTLVVLVQNSGHVVGKDVLMKEVWADSFVEESNLTQNIFVLRKVLGETPEGRAHIETVPKLGYRFAASVSIVQSDDTDLAPERQTRSRIISKDILPGGGEDVLNSLAVLPLINASANPDAEYLSDGITESIINSLSQLPQLRVMARSTVFRYKGKETDPQEIGQGLGVRAVLAGRVLQLGDRLIVRTELVDVANGWQLWGEQYNRELSDILALQEEISREISEKLRVKLTGEEKKLLAKRYTDNFEAYQLYLKGRYFWSKYTRDGLMKAIECFTQAIDLDPAYALAYSGLADSYYRLSNAYLSPKEALPKVKAAAMKAVEIDETLAEAHASLGLIKMYYDWNWLGAEVEYKRAIDLDPRSTLALHRYASFLMMMERFDEAAETLGRAKKLDPVSPQTSALLGLLQYLSHRYERAIEQYRKTLKIDPNSIQSIIGIGMAYEQLGLYEEAAAELRKARVLSGDITEVVAALGHVHAVSGKRSEAQNVLDELKKETNESYASPYVIATIYAALGEHERAFAWLEKAYEDRTEWLVWLKVDPKLDDLRADPRFSDLLRRVGFE